MRPRRVAVLAAALALGPATLVAPGGAVPGPRVVVGPPLNPSRLPPLPSFGLAVQVEDAVVLVRLDGRVIGHLDGLRLDESRLVAAPGPLVLVDRSARRLVLQPRRHRLARLAAGVRVPLAYGAELVQRRAGEGWQVVRRGVVVLRVPRGSLPVVSAARDVVTSQPLAVHRGARRRAIDLRSGHLRSLPRGCVAGARHAGRWFLLCLKPEPADPASALLPRVIALLGPHGWRGLLGPPPLGRAGLRLGAWSAIAVSPDGRRLLGQWSGACSTPVAVVAGADGRHARPVVPAAATRLLGFAPGGAALVAVTRAGCGVAAVRPAVYRVAPAGRRLALYPLTRRVGAVALWRSLG